MSDDFDELEIDGSIVGELTVVPSKEIRIHLFNGPRNSGDKQFVEEYDLVLERLHSYSFSIQAEPWLDIISHTLSPDSNYIAEYLAKKTKSAETRTHGISPKVFHFQLVFDEGLIDILAEGFSFSITNAIPFIDISKNMGDEETTGEIEITEDERECSFCGRERTEVTKIIVGAKGNICNECIAACANLLTT